METEWHVLTLLEIHVSNTRLTSDSYIFGGPEVGGGGVIDSVLRLLLNILPVCAAAVE